MIQLELQFIDKPKRECPECGGEVAGRSTKVYCSGRCQNAAQSRRWRQAYPEQKREVCRRWQRANPEKSREAAKKWRQANPEKHREISKRWQQANPEMSREKSKRWQRANPEKRKAHDHRRRAKKKANGVEPTGEYRASMTAPLTRQVCHYCGTDCTGNHHWDHHIPISAGGPEAPWNLVIACPTCNLRKKAKLPTSIFCEEIFKE